MYIEYVFCLETIPRNEKRFEDNGTFIDLGGGSEHREHCSRKHKKFAIQEKRRRPGPHIYHAKRNATSSPSEAPTSIEHVLCHEGPLGIDLPVVWRDDRTASTSNDDDRLVPKNRASGIRTILLSEKVQTTQAANDESRNCEKKGNNFSRKGPPAFDTLLALESNVSKRSSTLSAPRHFGGTAVKEVPSGFSLSPHLSRISADFLAARSISSSSMPAARATFSP